MTVESADAGEYRRAAEPAISRRSLRRRLIGEPVGFGLLGLVSVLVAWQLAVEVGLANPLLTSSPIDVSRRLDQLLRRGDMWHDIWVTLQEWGVGFLVAAVVGVLVGILAGWYRAVYRIVSPWLNVLNAAPELAFIPILIVWFGIGLQFKVGLAFIAAVFTITLNTIAGVRGTDPRHLDVATTFGAGPFRTLRTIVLPGSVPYIMTGIRMGGGRALVGVVAAEFMSSNSGLGHFVNVSGQLLNTTSVLAGIILLAIFGIAIAEILRAVERIFDSWRRTE